MFVNTRALSPCKRRQRLTWLLLLCFFVNGIASAFADPGDAAVDGRILICTTQGLQWLEVDGDPSPSDVTPSCVFCLNIDPDVDADPISQNSLPANSDESSVRLYGAEPTQTTRRFSDFLTRAPPYFS